MSIETRQLARAMVRLETLARREGVYVGYWATAAWQQREEVREHRSTLLRVEWAERQHAEQRD